MKANLDYSPSLPPLDYISNTKQHAVSCQALFFTLAIYLHVGYNDRMKPETITKALKQATDAHLASEKGIRDQAKRKTRSGGRPRKIVADSPKLHESQPLQDLR